MHTILVVGIVCAQENGFLVNRVQSPQGESCFFLGLQQATKQGLWQAQTGHSKATTIVFRVSAQRRQWQIGTGRDKAAFPQWLQAEQADRT